MTRRLMDGLIIVTVLAGATHLWAQGSGRKMVRPNQASVNGSVVRTGAAPNGAGGWYRAADGSFKRRGGAAISETAGSAVPCDAAGSVQRTTNRGDG